MNIIGIDPGLTGAVAVLRVSSDPNGYTASFVFHDTPIEEVKIRGKVKNNFLPTQMSEILSRYTGDRTTHIYIEDVHAMPKQGSVSMFRFGYGYGLWMGIIAALKIPVTQVTPQKWKKELMAGLADKDAARGRLMQLYPSTSSELKLKKHIGRADAGLLAEYGRRSIYRENEKIL